MKVVNEAKIEWSLQFKMTKIKKIEVKLSTVNVTNNMKQNISLIWYIAYLLQ